MQRQLFMCMAIAFTLSACGDPLVWLPGGELEGQVQSVPDEWGELPETLQIEFRPGKDPYSINIWAVDIGADVYIATGKDGTRWTQMLADDPAVRLRVGSAIYELMAKPVDDREELLRVRQRYIDKYDVQPDSSMLDGAMVFRLDL